jgi:hypothetical protein
VKLGRLVPPIVVMALVVLGAAPAGAQCAMCRQALESPEGQQLVAALRSGIAVLLVAPFALFGVIARLAIRADRRRRARDAQSQA